MTSPAPQRALAGGVRAGPGAGLPAPGPDDWARAEAAIRKAERILLMCHTNPDGDALGSMLGCALGLRRIGRPVQATFPSPYELPDTFAELPGLDLVVPPGEVDPEPEVVLCFDAASVERLGDLAARLDAAREVIVLDHHASYTGFGTVHLVDVQAAATAVMVDGLLAHLGIPLDQEIAECLYVAISTDTGSFKYQATTPEVHAFAARLLATGIEHSEISRRLFDTRPFGALRLLGDALGRAVLEPDGAAGRGLVWTYTTLGDLSRYRQRPHVLESLIDVVRTVEEADVTCVVKETAAGEWAVSLRSKGGLDVGRVAVALGGGGHRYASGFTGYGDLAEVVDSVRHTLAAPD